MACFSALPGPAFLVFLTSPTQAQGIGGNCLRDHGAGGEVRSGANLDWRNKCGIAPDKGAIADGSGVLFCAIVVAGDGSRSNVDSLSDFGIAEIRQVHGL